MTTSSASLGAQAVSAFVKHVDVLIVGAGISGIGGGYHLRTQCPEKTFEILETQETFGGTWSTHRYPGVRSDSDLYTFGYRFKPWVGAPIASAAEILAYLGAVIEENHLDTQIRYGHCITHADWSDANKCWTVNAVRVATGEKVHYTANFLWMCQGYYRHSEGYTPEWPNMAAFKGQLIHPQKWPGDLRLSGKRVLVIGSGATAATLVPAIANESAHVTMLQRSPTYFITGRNANDLADTLRELEIPQEWIHEIVRRKVLKDQATVAERAFSEPELLKRDLLAGVSKYLDAQTVEKHFTPRYQPWRQRIAFIPDADLFKSIQSGRASVVTDEIESFTESGVALKSGEKLDADVVVTATGFHLNVMGDISFTRNGVPVDFANTVTYRGAMFTGVPNMLWIFGYFRASWTLRVDLMADFFCRLLKQMDTAGHSVVEPTLREQDAGMTLYPWVRADNFNPGYLTRSVSILPKQGEFAPWTHAQDYWHEKNELPLADLHDGALQFR
jgi:cation diffusion facilitator CzcD-associated flavoprotein CzcO